MIYRFNDWELDTRKHELRCHGEIVEIEPKGFKLLQYLLENRNRLISRQELLEACWPRTHVNESVLTTSIGRVRRLIDPTPDPNHPLIQTVWGKGYRWVLEVTETAALPEPPLTAEQAATSKAVAAPDSQMLPATTPWQGIESRLLTVLSCHLSENAGAKPDWEEEHLKIQRLRHIVSDIIEPFQGYLASHHHPTLLVYFGYPQAHEDDARRAILSAWQLLNVSSQQHCNVVIGIHTAMAIVESSSETLSQEPIITGESAMIASELCRLAAPAGIVASARSVQLAGRGFDWQTLPPQSLLGGTERQLYRLVSTWQAALNIPAMRRHLTPFIERVAERALLQERWSQAREGRGQILLLSGEAGIGKTRLVMTLKQQIDAEAGRYLEGQCSPYQQNTSLAPLVMIVKQLLQWQPEDSQEMKLQALEELLQAHAIPLEQNQNLPLLADLLSLEIPEHYPPLTLEPRQRQQRLLELLLMLILQQSHDEPLLLIIEDLHWADPSTLQWLEKLIAQTPGNALMLVFTARPDFTSDWRFSTAVTSMVLERFGSAQIRQMITGISGGKALSPALQQQIIEKTDGVPLFIEELMQSLLESGQLRETGQGFELAADASTLSIPATLQGLLMARLDRLGAAKEVAYWGAVIGREFSYRLLLAVTSYDESALSAQLEKLIDSGLVLQHGVGVDARYLFKHALVQGAAYQSILKRQRQTMHQRIARMLETMTRSGEKVAPERLAQHYTEAGAIEQAIPYWQQAGEKAAARSALREAVEHFKQALALLEQRPETRQRQQQELALQLMLGSVLKIIVDSELDIDHVYQRAYQLCRKIGETPPQIPALWGLWNHYLNRVRLDIAQELAGRVLKMAEQTQQANDLMIAHEMSGTSMMVVGEFAIAREHFEQAIRWHNPKEPCVLPTQQGSYDFYIMCLSRLAWTLGNLGFTEQALRQNREARRLARQSLQPYTLPYVLHHTGLLHFILRQESVMEKASEELIEVATRHNYELMLHIGRLYQSVVQIWRGESIAENLKQMRQGLAACTASQTSLLMTPFWHYLLASAYASAGQIEQGLNTVDAALDQLDRMKRYNEWRAGLWTLKGQLCLQASPQTLILMESPEQAAGQYFQQACRLAEKQQEKLFQLRAATNLARLWQSQGHRKKAYQLLAPVYGWFSEGFDALDLQEAKGLLDELI